MTGRGGTVVRIEDPQDPRIAAYREVRERDLAGRDGLFVAEGVVVLEKLLGGARFRPRSVLVAEGRVRSLEPLLARVPETAPVYVANQGVMDAIAGFHIHRGVLAIGDRGAPVDPMDLLGALPSQAVVVVLMGLSNHDNVGGVFRNAAAFGADAVLLDAGCCDPLYRKAIRVSVGAALTVPFARLAAGSDALEALAAGGLQAVALSPSGAVELSAWRAPPRVAVLLGAEGPGLPADVMRRATSVRIPMVGGFDSLNVAVASGVVLHHLVAHRP